MTKYKFLYAALLLVQFAIGFGVPLSTVNSPEWREYYDDPDFSSQNNNQALLSEIDDTAAEHDEIPSIVVKRSDDTFLENEDPTARNEDLPSRNEDVPVQNENVPAANEDQSSTNDGTDIANSDNHPEDQSETMNTAEANLFRPLFKYRKDSVQRRRIHTNGNRIPANELSNAPAVIYIYDPTNKDNPYQLYQRYNPDYPSRQSQRYPIYASPNRRNQNYDSDYDQMRQDPAFH